MDLLTDIDTFDSVVNIEYARHYQNSRHQMRLMNLNVHSLRNKLSELESEICLYNFPEVVLCTETWLKRSMTRFYNVRGYKSYHVTRSDGYGGLVAFVKNTLKLLSPPVTYDTVLNVHVLVLKIAMPRVNLICVYRQPLSDMNGFLQLLDEVLESFPNSILMGDMNIDVLVRSSDTRRYMTTLLSNSYCLLNKVEASHYTFPTPNNLSSPGSILDHFATDLLDKTYVMYMAPSVSDHFCVHLSVNESSPAVSKTRKRFFNNARIKREIAEYVAYHDVCDVSTLHSNVERIVRESVYYRDFDSIHFDCPWMNATLMNEMRHRNYLQRMTVAPGMSRNQRALARETFRRQRNRVTYLTRLAKKDFVKSQVEQSMGNARRMWKTLKGVLNNTTQLETQSLPSEMKRDSLSTTQDPREMTNVLNCFFTNVSANLRQNLMTSNHFRPRNLTLDFEASQSVYLRRTNSDEIVGTLTRLRTGSSPGLDGVSSATLKSSSDSLCDPLVRMFNDCFESGTFPASFKDARVTAIYKGSGSRSDPNSYRPVTVLSSFAKILEELLYERIQDFLLDCQIIHANQFGFQSGSNTVTAAIHAVSFIQRSLCDKNFVTAIFIDVAKAFDCVDHELLLHKLSIYGFQNRFLDILNDYLFARKQLVMMDGCKSEERFVPNGVPQGSKLSTLLFLVFVNDIFDLPLRGRLQLYADDAILTYTSENPLDLHHDMENDMHLMNAWFYDNLLSLNLSKTKYMLFTPRGMTPPQLSRFFVNGNEIERTSSCRYLGLIIDEKLCWHEHIDLVKGNVSPFLAMLKRTIFMIPESLRLSIYYAYVHSRFTYLISIWGFASRERIGDLQILQNKAIRSIFHEEYDGGGIDTIGLMRKYGILSVRVLCKYDCLMNIFKYRRGLLKRSEHLSFETFDQVHSYNTRGSARNLYALPDSRTNVVRDSLSSQGLIWFNELPSHFHFEHDLIVFKRNLKIHLLNDVM